MHNRFSCGPWSGHVQLDGLLLIKEWAPRIPAGSLEAEKNTRGTLKLSPSDLHAPIGRSVTSNISSGRPNMMVSLCSLGSSLDHP